MLIFDDVIIFNGWFLAEFSCSVDMNIILKVWNWNKDHLCGTSIFFQHRKQKDILLLAKPWIPSAEKSIWSKMIFTRDYVTRDFHSWLRHCWKPLAITSLDQKSLFTVTHALISISFEWVGNTSSTSCKPTKYVLLQMTSPITLPWRHNRHDGVSNH